MLQFLLQVVWELTDVVVPVLLSAVLLEDVEDALEDLVEFGARVVVVNDGGAEVREVLLDCFCVAGYCVAEALVGLVLLVVVVALDVAKADAPLLGYFVEVLGHCLGVDEAESSQSD